jgi:hypothetical protein
MARSSRETARGNVFPALVGRESSQEGDLMPKRLELEPIPTNSLPRDLRDLPAPFAMEMYAYRAVGRGPARVFYREYEDSLRAKLGKKAHFRVHDLVLYIASVAGAGIIQNLAYDALKALVRKIRRPKQELGGSGFRFEAVVSRRKYNRVRRERHPDRASRKGVTEEVEQGLETQYRLIVKLTRNSRR